MIMVGRDSRREARKMAVRVSATSGFDLGYVWRNLGGEPERTAGGYYINAAQAGEAPGRWFGAGAEAAGLAEGSVVDRDVYDQVYNQVSPLTGQKMGRAPGGYAKFADHLARLEAAEPHATWERRLELERIAVQQTRRSPAYTDVLVSFDKTISIVHASIWENERRARLAGDEAAAALWRDREARWSEVLQDANVRGLRYLHEQGSFTRTGYHARRIPARPCAQSARAGGAHRIGGKGRALAAQRSRHHRADGSGIASLVVFGDHWSGPIVLPGL